MSARRLANYVSHLALLTLLSSPVVAADDWPMWRYDATRSAASPNELDSELNLVWQKQFSARTQAWDDPLNLDLMTYDRVFEPIVIDGRLIVGFNDRDKVVAMDTDTGQQLWTFYTEAPVRMPPVGSAGQVYFTSDDGCLYCVDAADGALQWKFNGAPNAQHAIGNRRLTSAWPARGGPVVRDDTVYFAASIWPFMGTFIYALDAQTGEVRWVNDRTGSQYIKQPHSAPSFAGVAPQGALVATESLLIVPGGRSVPAVFGRDDGEMRYFELNAGGKGTGGSFVAADHQHFYVHTRKKGTRAFKLDDGVKTAFMPNEPVLHDGTVYSAESKDDGSLVRAYRADQKLDWEIEADGSGDLILAGRQLIAAGAKQITVIQLPESNRPARIVKSIPTDKPIERLIVADGKLFAVSIDGRLRCYGRGKPMAQPGDDPPGQRNPSDDARRVAGELLATGDASGYAFWFGRCDHPTAMAMAAESPFVQLAIVDTDSAAIDRTRRRLDADGHYGRVTVHHSDPRSFQSPNYVANMVFVADAEQLDEAEIQSIYQSVRPYGGVMHLLGHDNQAAIAQRVGAMHLEQAVVTTGEHGVIVRRAGALPGSADWTHQYGDIANTVKSNDSRVKLPLGVLWFGGSSNMDVLPRHGHGPPEQVVGGRLFIQGMNSLSARDVYTGRVLWKRDFADLGTYDVYYDQTYENLPLDPKYNQVHIPGANARGTNYVVTEDRVYIVEGSVCHALDPATGELITDFQLPPSPTGEQEQWGYLGVYKDVLIGGLGFAMYRERNHLSFDSDKKLKSNKAGFGSKSYDRAASVALVGFDRHSGKQLWKVDARHSFWHNGIVAGGGKVYCLDRTPKQIADALLRRGQSRSDTYRIMAFDFQTGKQEWEISDNIFGSWLGYSEQHDLLLQAGARASDRLADEVAAGMAVYRGDDGSVKWSNPSLQYSGPCILHNDLIITNANSYSESAGAFFLETGKPKLLENPLTGESEPWKITRAYGCNSIIASENLLTFRSGAAGFYDLLTHSGTGNLGGFKSGCTSNLVVANGVLNAPDYTRTCSCAYQNQTSLALVHMPEIETWSVHNGASDARPGEMIRNLAINFGAPGDRRDEDGMLWLEHPVVAGDSPPLSVMTNPDTRYFSRHSSTAPFADRPWVAASGADGITELRLALTLTDKNDAPGEHEEEREMKRYDVELVFAAPQPGEKETRVFDVHLQNKRVAENVTIDGVEQTTSTLAFHDVEIGNELQVQFIAKQGAPVLSGIKLERQ
ncbi:PQQ-binding-like beta-propeller repeat protein [Stieleria sp. ICT_E10.1]|uniref:outer membrane protein assembly factor BamB family protein n=1 Tax=Stieleria sedimenti TaxID=2976331 RepID=UPI00217FBC8A|nr:PQQ-binding-like beta-propeller repeat protein [Stieleria sedimenti]MCS7468097.1 PQQ-binding-like beta-propeller repeat protein [Stieleria sedimenti]